MIQLGLRCVPVFIGIEIVPNRRVTEKRKSNLSGFVNVVLNLPIRFLKKKKKDPQFKKVYGIGLHYNQKKNHLRHFRLLRKR